MAATAAATITPPGANTLPANTWFAYKTSSGDYGLGKQGHTPANATGMLPVGAASSLSDLVTNFSPEINAALKALGTPSSIWAALIKQLDSGAVLGNPTYVQAGGSTPGGGVTRVSSDAPTAIGSEATNAGLPDVSLPSVSFLGVLGSLQFWKGIGLVIGGVLILILAGLEIRKL